MRVTGVSRDNVTLTWEAPECDGGSALTSYVVEKCDAKKSMWFSAGSTENATTRNFKVKKLFEGTDYFFRVAAENKIGVGEFVALPNPVTVKLPFGKPTGIYWVSYVI